MQTRQTGNRSISNCLTSYVNAYISINASIKNISIIILLAVSIILVSCTSSSNEGDSLASPQPTSTNGLILDSDQDGVVNFYDAAMNDKNSAVLGNGTIEAPYLINNVYQLQAIAGFDHEGNQLNVSTLTNGFLYGNNTQEQLNKHYRLSVNIDANETITWNQGLGLTPIGGCGADNDCEATEDNYPFSGSLDGNSLIISELRIHRRSLDGIGLFGLMDNQAEVVNLKLHNIKLSGRDHVGGVVGYQKSGSLSSVEVSGSIVGNNYLGGLSGSQLSGKIISVTANQQISGNNFIGAISGISGDSIIAAATKGRISGNNNIGGIVGVKSAGEIIFSYSQADVNGNKNVGGAIGLMTDGEISFSYTTEKTQGTSAIGGLVGRQSAGDIISSYSSGEIIGDKDTGFVGNQSDGNIVSSYWNIDVSEVDTETAGVVGLTDLQLSGCGLNGKIITGASSAASCMLENSEVLFPVDLWNSSVTDEISGSWVFEPSYVYPVLSVKDANNKNILSEVATACELGESKNELCATAVLAKEATQGMILGTVRLPLAASSNASAAQQEAEQIVYELTSNFSGLFNIDSRSGAISIARETTVGDPGKYELSIKVNVTDEAEDINSKLLDQLPAQFDNYFSVELINLAPEFAQELYVFETTKDLVFAEELAVVATDPEEDDIIYSISDARFVISTNGVISPEQVLPIGNYSMQVTARDEFNAEAIVNVTLVVATEDTDADGVGDDYDSYPQDNSRHIEGRGTTQEPFMIRNIYQLQAISGVDHLGNSLNKPSPTGGWLYGNNLNEHLSAFYILANDIDAAVTQQWNNGKGFFPIGSCGDDNDCDDGLDNNLFNGSFYGASNNIIDLYIDRPNLDGVGLFGIIGEPAALSYINMNNSLITGRDNVGALVGSAAGVGSAAAGEILSVVADAVIINGGNNVGGLVGHLMSGTIANSSVIGEVRSTDHNIGGLVGYKSSGKITLSRANASVTGENQVGGLVGHQLAGTINASSSTGSVTGLSYVGGLIGEMADGDIQFSYSASNVMATFSSGGFAGQVSNGTISNCYATGNVQGNDFVGGITGYQQDGTISSCYASANVTSQGALAGFIAHQVGGTINGSYSISTVNNIGSGAQEGGFVASQEGTIISSYWDTDISGYTDSVGDEVGATTEQLQGCELDGGQVTGSSADCSGLFPASEWGEETYDGIIRSWEFTPVDEYPRWTAPGIMLLQ